MKKVLSILTALMMTIMVTGCQKTDSNLIKIGIIQLAEHEALDSAYNGFVERLAELGYKDGENIKIEYQNAQGDTSNCITIADKLVNDKKDLILAIATPAAMAVANKTKDIPILCTAVTDYAFSNLVKDNNKPDTNVSGTSDLNPIDKQVDLLLQIVPEAKNVAILYCSSEPNSEVQAKEVERLLAEKNIKATHATVVTSNDIKQVVEALNGKVDAIYAPTDNVISDAMVTVSDICNSLKIPTIVGEPVLVDKGGLATVGIDYNLLGRMTAEMAVDILKNGNNPANMPIQYSNEFAVVLNEKTASTIGIELPKELVEKADRIVK